MSRRRNSHRDPLEHNPASGFKPNKLVTRNDNQLKLREALLSKDIILCTGPPGTGKTHVATAVGVQLLKNEKIDKLAITRPTVDTGSSIGFLPGSMLEKVSPYLRPLFDEISYYINTKHLNTLIENEVVEIVPLCMMRGRTFVNTYVILDEAQNATFDELKMFLTRIGPGSTLVLTGDLLQSDLPKCLQGAFQNCVNKISDIDGVGLVRFGRSDIVRHKIIADIEDRLNG